MALKTHLRIDFTMADQKFNNTLRMKKRFATLLKTDFGRASIGSVKRALGDALGPLPEINRPMKDTSAVIRARTIDEAKEDITKPETFGAPPSIETTQGRANLINFPVLYGTFDARTAMQEIKVPLHTECYVAIWEFESAVATVTTFLSNAEKRNDFFVTNDRLPKDVHKKLKGGYTKSSLDQGMKLRAELFTDENYDITSKIAHDIIHNNSSQSHGILYPSVIDPYRCNIALNPDFVAANMRCALVYKMVWSGAFIFRMLARGVNEKGVVVWKQTGSWEFDDLDRKYLGGHGPDNIHPSALKVLADR